MIDFQDYGFEYNARYLDYLTDAQEENEKFLFALEHWDELKNLFGFVLRVDGQIVAYRINAKMNLERGILTQNITGDFGEKNLRFFKEHLTPLIMMKKFKVTYKPARATELPTIETREDHGLKISFERLKKDLKISLAGKLNTDAANWSKNNILTALEGAEKVTFDLKGLKYISSSGLRILVAAMKKINSQGEMMTVKNVGEQVREVLDMTGFLQIFNVEA